MTIKATTEIFSDIERTFRTIRLKSLILPVIGIAYFFTPGMHLFSGVVLFAQTFLGREVVLSARKRDIVDTYVEQACDEDNPAILDYLVARFPEVKLSKSDYPFYSAVYKQSWRVVEWFFASDYITHSAEMEERISERLKDQAPDTIRQLRATALYTKLDAEIEQVEEEDDAPLLKI
jgi:hypothetical protein